MDEIIINTKLLESLLDESFQKKWYSEMSVICESNLGINMLMDEIYEHKKYSIDGLILKVIDEKCDFPFYAIYLEENGDLCINYYSHEVNKILTVWHIISDSQDGYDIGMDEESMKYLNDSEGYVNENGYRVMFFGLFIWQYVQYKLLTKKRTIIQFDKYDCSSSNSSSNKSCDKYFSLDDEIIYCRKTPSGKKYQRHTESWNVRGFYRHYKNGKTVFIDGYTKGKGDVKGKKYLMKGGEVG